MTSIEEKIAEDRLRWFGYVLRRPIKELLRRVNCIVFSLAKEGGRPRKWGRAKKEGFP